MLNLRIVSVYMRNNPGHILLCLVLALGFGFSAAALPQGDDYDKALDKYAAICDRCVRLRANIESGQGVREEELKTLLTELSSLRRTLSNASGKMTAVQRGRFETIKAKYRRGMQPSGQTTESKCGNIPDEKPVPPRFSPLPDVVTLPVAKATVPVAKLVEVTSHSFQSGPLRQASFPRKNPKPFGFSFLADAGMFPAPSFGAMAVVTRGGVGGYINCRSDFRANDYSYDCSSDGDTEYGRIWATGNSRASRFVATAGLAMVTSGRFGFYAGGGLTSYTRCLEDVSGQWARVKDESFKTLAVDAGLFMRFNPFVLSVGVTSDFTGHSDVQVGVGLRFR